MVDPWIPLLSALVSGVVVKVVDHTYVRHEKSFDDAVAIRQELRDEVHRLHRDLTALQRELDRWKQRYYDLTIHCQGLQVECQQLRAELDELREHDDLRAAQHVQYTLSELRHDTPAQEVPHGTDTPSDLDANPDVPLSPRLDGGHGAPPSRAAHPEDA